MKIEKTRSVKKVNTTLEKALEAATNGIITTSARTPRGLVKHLKSHPLDIRRTFCPSNQNRENAVVTYSNGKHLDSLKRGIVSLQSYAGRYPAKSYQVVALADSECAAQAEELTRQERPRKKNITSASPHRDLGNGYHTAEERFEYRGQFRGWYNTRLKPKYLSVAYITPRIAKLIQFDEVSKRPTVVVSRRAPVGLHYNVDNLGLRLVSRDGTDIHINANDLLRKDLGGWVKSQMSAKRRAKRDTKQGALHKATVEKNAKLISQYLGDPNADWPVTLDDSLAAHNCREGSIAFAMREFRIRRDEASLLSISARALLGTCDVRARNAATKALHRLIASGGQPGPVWSAPVKI